MKKILLIISLCFISILAISQNYEPFLFGKTYRYLNPKDSTLILQKIDSVSVNVDGDSVFYSVRKKELCDFNKNYSDGNVFINSTRYIKKNDVYLFENPGRNGNGILNKKNRLIVNPKLNQIWKYDSTNQYFLKYMGKKQLSFSSLIDSVKVYYVLSDSLSANSLDTIYLSKNYGFVNGFDNYSLYSITELGIGLKEEINYNPAIGDTMVYGACNPSDISMIIVANTENSIKNIANRIYNYTYSPEIHEEIEKNVFYLTSTCDNFERDTKLNYKQYSGLVSETFVGADGCTCCYLDRLLYQKNKKFEFGDRKELDKIMSVDDKELNISFKICPNPSSGIVNIDLQNQEAAQVSVLDSKGVEVYNSEILNSNLTLKLNAGIYLVKVVSKNQVAVNKLVVE